MLDRDGLRQWFESWEGPVHVTSQPPTILVDGDLGVLLTLQNMGGTKKGESETDLWFRCTVAVRRIAGAWKIVYIHTSAPESRAVRSRTSRSAPRCSRGIRPATSRVRQRYTRARSSPYRIGRSTANGTSGLMGIATAAK